MIRVISFAAGLTILGGMAHYLVTTGSGWDSPEAMVYAFIAVVLAVGAVVAGRCYQTGHWWLFGGAIAAMLCAEVYQFAQLAERTMLHRAEAQQILRVAELRRAHALARVERLHAAATASTSVRLDNALRAKADIDARAAKTSAERHCGRQCRAMLQGQIDAAASDVEAARQALRANQVAARSALAKARADLAAMPVPPSSTMIANGLGVEPLTVEMILAALRSVGVNLAACIFLSFAAHGGIAHTSTPERPGLQIARFSVERYEPCSNGYVCLCDMLQEYREWCRDRREKVLPSNVFAVELAHLVDTAKLEVEHDPSGDSRIYGMRPIRLIETAKEDFAQLV